MSFRITVVLEYATRRDLPSINARTKAADLGNGEVTAVQFSDALRELEVLENDASEATKDAAWRASESYPGAERLHPQRAGDPDGD